MKKIAIIGCGSIGSAIATKLLLSQGKEPILIDATPNDLFPDQTTIDEMIPMKEIKPSFQKSKSKFHK